MNTWPDQDEYPEADMPRPSAAQLWEMWRAERKRADEIEEIGRRWMADSCAARRALDEAKAESLHAKSAMAEQIATLIRERDEARRELCAAKRELCRNEAIIRLQRHRVHRDSEDVVGLAKEIAVERGWDCFKEAP